MTPRSLSACLPLTFVLALPLVACGGKISDAIVGQGSLDGGAADSGVGIGADSGVGIGADSGIVVVTVDGAACVDVNLDTYSQACVEDSDCTLVRVGELCSGQCSCGDTPINVSGEARYAAQTSPLTLEGCPCAFPGIPRCIASVCTLCGFGPGQPPGCSDAGTTTPVDSGIDLPDSGVMEPDGGILVGPDAGELSDAGESLDGTWTGAWTVMEPHLTGTGSETLQLTVQGSTVSGTVTYTQAAPCFTTGELMATLSGSEFAGTIVDGMSMSAMSIKVSVTGNTMTGAFTVSSGSCAGFVGTFTATR